MGILAEPPDPAWAPVWKLIQDMEALGTCPFFDPRTRTRTIIVEPLAAIQEVPLIVPKKRVRDKILRKDIIIPSSDEQELPKEEVIDISDDRLMQQKRSAMVRMIRDLRKSLDVSREKYRLAFVDNCLAEELRAAKAENANLRLDKKKISESLAELKAKTLMAEREITDQMRIDQAVDLSKISMSVPAKKLINSYTALNRSKTPEEIMGWAVRREYAFNQAIMAMERAKAALDLELKAKAAREAERIKADLAQGIITKTFSSEECQTDVQLDVILLQEISLQKERHLAIQDKSRTEYVPALKGKDAEDRLQSVLVQMAPINTTVLITRGIGHCSDFMLIFREVEAVVGYAMIDCKSYSAPVPTKEVDKFERDIDHCTKLFGCVPRWSAIISVESDIVHEGVSGAPDFDHGTTPVFLIHSGHRSGDIGTTVREMLSKAKYVENLRPFVPATDAASVEITAFEKKITEKKKGKGRSHSQSKLRVTFGEKSQSRQRSQSRTKETEPDEEVEEIQLGTVLKSSKDVAIGLDPRIFTTAEVSQAYLNIAEAMSKVYKYEEGKIEQNIDIITTMMRLTKLSKSVIGHALKEILIPTLRKGHKTYNISLI